jgi:hypothetical protein
MDRSKVIVIDRNRKIDRKLKVCAYVRVSTDSDDQMNSYRMQLQHYQNYIQSNDKWIFVDIYADEGVSGRSLKNRNEFKRMFNDCRSNKIDRIQKTIKTTKWDVFDLWVTNNFRQEPKGFFKDSLVFQVAGFSLVDKKISDSNIKGDLKI